MPKKPNNISTTNDALESDIKLNIFTVRTLPILVYLNNETNCDATNIRSNISPSPFKLFIKHFEISFSVLIFYASYHLYKLMQNKKK